MKVGRYKQHALLSWLFVGTLAVLSAVLGILQYGWIGEVSRAERDRLQTTLHTGLQRVRHDFNAEITTACSALIPPDLEGDAKSRESQYAARFEHWRDSSPQSGLWRRLLLVEAGGSSLILRELDLETGAFRTVDWPGEWNLVRDRLAAKLSRTEGHPPPMGVTDDFPDLIEIPIFPRRPEEWQPGGPPNGRPNMHELGWLLLQFDLDYVRTSIIPALLQRDLPGGTGDYYAAIVIRDSPDTVIYQSQTDDVKHIGGNADASVSLFDVNRAHVQRGAGPRNRGGPPGSWLRMGRRGPPPPEMGDNGRWLLSVRHRAGSLEAVVARARSRNLAVMGGLVLLILSTVVALVQFTRRAQKLAELQMEFVAGVSHELRTPLTVMRTAGHNLRGKVSTDPVRVQRYGALIQEQSQKLTGIVEQILSFANMKAGRVIGEQQPISLEPLIEDALESDAAGMDLRGIVEKNIAIGLPPIMGDPTTLKLALQNLLTNAAKYGGGDWVGLSALLAPNEKGSMIEITVADRGEGIPPDEIEKIFEPFYRGKKPTADQVHGTGLGLSLAKRIVEAHGGKLAVSSQVGKGTQFVMRIPVAVVEQQHEFANSSN
jgi:signal transduction histidine kinase